MCDNNKTNLRKAYEQRFPAFSQHLLTWLTGKALPGQRPFWRLSPWIIFATLLSMFCGSVYCAVLLVMSGYVGAYALLPFIWVLTVAGAMGLELTVRHECEHAQFTGHRRVDTFIMEFITIILFIRNGEGYRDVHVKHHHRQSYLSTHHDPHVMVLGLYGFRAGMSRTALWRQLWKTLFSPLFHVRHIALRAKTNYDGPHLWRKIACTLYLLSWVTLVVLTPVAALLVTLGFVIPVFVLTNMTFLLEIISEHPWSPTHQEPTVDATVYAQKCRAIFCGAPLPALSLSRVKKISAYGVWGIRMVGHFIIRLTVLPGPLCAHDLHHRAQNAFDWREAAYARERIIAQLPPSAPPYRETWGLKAALNDVFTSISQAPADENT
tara:strand:+ start:9097 stop:10233 length:1137 start_codon:yes stop_codon:yes gene_type:complete